MNSNVKQAQKEGATVADIQQGLLFRNKKCFI
jgi:activator of 2-hydroxyglutaryl-CoA dehydratase